MQTFKNLREDSLEEVLKAMDPTGKWIHDFVHSDNPKFAGKTKKERIHMALGAAYAAKKQEENVAEGSTSQQKAHEYNLDAAQKEMDSRHAEGEDMTGAKIDKKTYQIVKPKKPKVNEAEMDPREYDYEGDMAKSQLRSIIMNAQQVHDMLEDDTNMAEWVQNKITLAADYISTVADYMAAEMKEEVEYIDELNKDTLYSYAKKSEKDQDKQFNKVGIGIRDKDPKSANKAGHKFSMRSIGQNRAYKRLTAEKKD